MVIVDEGPQHVADDAIDPLHLQRLVVLWWWGDPKINEAPNTSCNDVHNAPVKRGSRSETMASGSSRARPGTPSRGSCEPLEPR